MIPAYVLRKPGVIVQGGLPARARARANSLNKTELRYRDMLETMKRGGLIQDYAVQSVTLKIGDDCRYLPDFLVIELDGTIKFIEIKGFLRDDALVKFRAAQEKFWWAKFEMIQYDRREGWKVIRN